MPPPVNARIPLSLLEAIRRMDTPKEDVEATEFVQELRNKRLGLSETVYLQIRRYSDAAKRGHLIPYAEASGLGTLIGRRPDADALFRSAGRILAKEVYSAVPSTHRSTIRKVPGIVARPLALKHVKGISENEFGGTLTRTGAYLTLSIPHSVTVNGAPSSAGCVFYESALRELLDLLIDGGGQVEHLHCTQRGDEDCQWRTEWRASSAPAQ